MSTAAPEVAALLAIAVVVALATLAGAGLGWAARRRRDAREPLVARIDALLPQTQCGQCGYAGCRPYARALAAGEADIDQCPPGGAAGARALATLLGRDAKPVNPANGVEKPPVVAVIVEADCIGCTKCLQACPVDAIVGGPKLMHTVVAELCTGCELCVPPCPVDCIELLPIRVTAPHDSLRESRAPAHHFQSPAPSARPPY